MKKILFIVIVSISLLMLFACSVDISKSLLEYGYLRLDGSMVNREAYIDGQIVGIDPEYDANTIPLRVGTHHLEIRSKNRILLEDNIIIEPDKVTRVTVP